MKILPKHFNSRLGKVKLTKTYLITIICEIVLTV